MKKITWTDVDGASGNSSKLPAGGYVVRITEVEDDDKNECIVCTYDIAEGDYAGHYSDDWASKNAWAHQFKRWYSDKAQPFFKSFLDAIEASNTGFTVERWQAMCNPFELEGKLIGVVFGAVKYTNRYGDDKERLDAKEFVSADDIRNGNYKVPEVEDRRDHTEGVVGQGMVGESSTADAYDDIPFM